MILKKKKYKQTIYIFKSGTACCMCHHCVYFEGKLNVWDPIAPIIGNRPTFGIMLYESFSVTFLFPL